MTFLIWYFWHIWYIWHPSDQPPGWDCVLWILSWLWSGNACSFHKVLLLLWNWRIITFIQNTTFSESYFLCATYFLLFSYLFTLTFKLNANISLFVNNSTISPIYSGSRDIQRHVIHQVISPRVEHYLDWILTETGVQWWYESWLLIRFFQIMSRCIFFLSHLTEVENCGKFKIHWGKRTLKIYTITQILTVEKFRCSESICFWSVCNRCWGYKDIRLS